MLVNQVKGNGNTTSHLRSHEIGNPHNSDNYTVHVKILPPYLRNCGNESGLQKVVKTGNTQICEKVTHLQL